MGHVNDVTYQIYANPVRVWEHTIHALRAEVSLCIVLSCRLHAADRLGDVEAELVLGQPLPADGLLLALRREVGDADLRLK